MRGAIIHLSDDVLATIGIPDGSETAQTDSMGEDSWPVND